MPSTITFKQEISYELTYKEWYERVKGDYKNEKFALNKWEAMVKECRGEYVQDEDEMSEECWEQSLSELEDTTDVSDECEECGDVSDECVTHSFGCIALCETCSLDKTTGEPHCPRKHADSESDPCDWCDRYYDEHYKGKIVVQWDTDKTEGTPPPSIIDITTYECRDDMPSYLSDTWGFTVLGWKPFDESDKELKHLIESYDEMLEAAHAQLRKFKDQKRRAIAKYIATASKPTVAKVEDSPDVGCDMDGLIDAHLAHVEKTYGPQFSPEVPEDE
jgi:hypothetical protein